MSNETVKVIPNTPAMRALAAEAMLNVARMIAPPGATLQLQQLKGDALLQGKGASAVNNDRGQDAA